VVLVGRSAPVRPGTGGTAAQALRHLRRSGPRLLPFLTVNYALPRWMGRARRGLGGGGASGGALAAAAAARGVPIVEVRDVNGPEAAAAIRQAAPDLLVSFHFDQIFAPATLALAPRGGINLHPSLLPRHRGPVPTLWALAEERPAFGVTVHRLVPRIDAGPVLAQAAVTLPEGTTASAAARALHEAGAALLGRVLAALAEGREEAPRESAPLPYCSFPPPAMLRALARRGRRAVDLGDLRAALRARVG
jgi:methionyl-tRNA formyltransferase